MASPEDGALVTGGPGRRGPLLPVSGGAAFLRLALRPIWRRFEAAVQAPEAAQQALWEAIRRECGGSRFWRSRWGKASDAPLEALPVTEYSDYRDAFDEAFETGHPATTTSPIAYWAETSGTTARKTKRFPYADWGRELRLATLGPIGAYLYRLAVVEPHIPWKPALVLANAGTHPPSPTGVPVGWATAYAVEKVPPFAVGALAIPRAVYRRPDLWEQWAPLYAAATDLSIAVGLSAAYLVGFHDALLERMEAYWPYLEGRAEPPAPLPPVRVRPRRLRRLRDVFRGGAPTIRDVWPRLAAVLCWTSASSAMQVPWLEPRLGGVPLRDYPYVCTEAPLTVPLYDGEEGHPLHPGATIVELLPDGAEPAAANLLPAWKVEPGRRYEVFLTTANGLVRYRLHDLVECTGWFHRSPRLVFRSKTAFILKLSQSSIPEDDVVRLLRRVGYRGRDDLLLGPHPSRVTFALYVREGSDPGPIAEPLDCALREASGAYDFERGRNIIGPVEVITVPAAHAMWDFRTRAQAKSRCILPEPPGDLPPGAAGG